MCYHIRCYGKEKKLEEAIIFADLSPETQKNFEVGWFQEAEVRLDDKKRVVKEIQELMGNITEILVGIQTLEARLQRSTTIDILLETHTAIPYHLMIFGSKENRPYCVITKNEDTVGYVEFKKVKCKKF